MGIFPSNFPQQHRKDMKVLRFYIIWRLLKRRETEKLISYLQSCRKISQHTFCCLDAEHSDESFVLHTPKLYNTYTTMRIQTGQGTIPLITLIGIWSISALNALPGLAVSPILGSYPSSFHTPPNWTYRCFRLCPHY